MIRSTLVVLGLLFVSMSAFAADPTQLCFSFPNNTCVVPYLQDVNPDHGNFLAPLGHRRIDVQINGGSVLPYTTNTANTPGYIVIIGSVGDSFNIQPQIGNPTDQSQGACSWRAEAVIPFTTTVTHGAPGGPFYYKPIFDGLCAL